MKKKSTRSQFHGILIPAGSTAPRVSDAASAAYYLARMVGAGLSLFAVCALEVCTIFAEEIEASPEQWLHTFGASGITGWALLLIGVVLTWWAHVRFQRTERTLQNYVIKPSRLPLCVRA